MITSDDFTEYYKTISNTELLIILDNPDGYQPLAIEAAKKEFSNRQLTDLDIKEAKEPIIAKQIQKEKQQETVKAIENKIITAGNTLFDTINPIQSGIASTEKIIRLIVLFFGGTFLYLFLKNFQLHFIYIKDFSRFPIDSILYFIPLLLLSSASLLFWKRKTSGWILLSIFLTFSIVTAVWAFINYFFWKPSGHEWIDKAFPKPDLIKLITLLVFVTGIQYVLCKENIKKVFKIDKNIMLATIGITGLLTLFLIYLSV